MCVFPVKRQFQLNTTEPLPSVPPIINRNVNSLFLKMCRADKQFSCSQYIADWSAMCKAISDDRFAVCFKRSVCSDRWWLRRRYGIAHQTFLAPWPSRRHTLYTINCQILPSINNSCQSSARFRRFTPRSITLFGQHTFRKSIHPCPPRTSNSSGQMTAWTSM